MSARHGWTSAGLTVVSPDDPRFWSVADASRLLGPPELTEAQVRQLVRLAGLAPRGKRSNGPRRRHVRVYDATALIDAFETLAGLMGHQG